MHPKNNVYSELTASYTHGISESLVLADASLFPDEGVVSLANAVAWVLLRYAGKDNNTLTGVTPAEDVSASPNADGYTFPIGTRAGLSMCADYFLVEDKSTDPDWVGVKYKFVAVEGIAYLEVVGS